MERTLLSAAFAFELAVDFDGSARPAKEREHLPVSPCNRHSPQRSASLET